MRLLMCSNDASAWRAARFGSFTTLPLLTIVAGGNLAAGSKESVAIQDLEVMISYWLAGCGKPELNDFLWNPLMVNLNVYFLGSGILTKCFESWIWYWTFYVSIPGLMVYIGIARSLA